MERRKEQINAKRWKGETARWVRKRNIRKSLSTGKT